MCGILGYYAANNHNNLFNTKNALKHLNHRGPDENNIYQHHNIALAHTRLSIIDLNGGHQPIHSANNRWCLSYNGEIYNFPLLKKELENKGHTICKHSDTDILIRLIEVYGVQKTLSKIRGMFAFAVLDKQKQELWIARDRLGVKPLVYTETQDGFAFSSEIGTLLKLYPSLSPSLNNQAIDDYLSFQYIPAPMTGFNEIKKLPPAHFLKIKRGKITDIQRYWDIDHTKTYTLSFQDACEAIRQKFLEATKIRMISDVPLGAFLSGGVDSTITVAAMQKLSNKQIKTFSIGFEDKQLNELAYAKEAATFLNTNHQELTISPNAADIIPKFLTHYGEPHADNSIIPTFSVCNFARQQVTVALTGDGADEIFGGYKRMYQIHLLEKLEQFKLLKPWRLSRKLTVTLENLFKKNKRKFPHTKADQALFLPKDTRFRHLVCYFNNQQKIDFYTKKFLSEIDLNNSNLYFKKLRSKASKNDLESQIMYLEMASYQANCILPKVDMASMLNSLECRSPFMDHEFIELAYTLPGHFKFAGRNKGKHIIKEAFKDWVPEGFFNRPKMGFSSPVGSWLKNELAEPLQELLIVENILKDICNQKVLQKYISQHLNGTKNHTKQLWALFILAQWMKIFNLK